MKISVLTIAYNSAATIEDTIASVLSQTYASVEYIVKDGGSADATLAIMEKYKSQIKVVSKPDAGIYDAMNQAVALATGEVVGILNSDDFYATPDVLTSVAEIFKDESVQAVYGDLVYVAAEDTSKITRVWKAGHYRRENFLSGWMPPHPTFFVRRSVYEQYGSFDASFKSAGDYELMLRFLYKHDICVKYLPKTLIHMRAGGVSNASFKNRLRANREDRRAWEINGLKPRWYTLLAKPISKITQFIRR